MTKLNQIWSNMSQNTLKIRTFLKKILQKCFCPGFLRSFTQIDFKIITTNRIYAKTPANKFTQALCLWHFQVCSECVQCVCTLTVHQVSSLCIQCVCTYPTIKCVQCVHFASISGVQKKLNLPAQNPLGETSFNCHNSVSYWFRN